MNPKSVGATVEAEQEGVTYRLFEERNCVLINGKNRVPVRIAFEPTFIRVEPLAECGYQPRQFAFFCYHDLIDFSAQVVMSMWSLPADRPVPKDCFVRLKIEEWARQQTGRVLAHRFHPLWRAQLARLNPDVVGVHRAVFHTTCAGAELAFNPTLYGHKFLVQDIVRFPAAAAALRYASFLVSKALGRPWAPEYMEDLAPPGSPTGPIADEEQIEHLVEWRNLFSDTGKPYRSLNRTLAHMHAPLSSNLVRNLCRVHLPRPLLDRMELNFFVASLAEREAHINTPVFARARRGEIQKAMGLVANHTGNELSPRRAKDLGLLGNFLADYPDRHSGSVVGLARKSVAWHRYQATHARTKEIERLGLDRRTAFPPLPLPDVPGLHFLSTVADLVEEGETMSNCIATYAARAASGQCFLFHADFQGEQASIEVSPVGEIVQALGPHNHQNRASEWGAGVLRKWAALLKPVGHPV